MTNVCADRPPLATLHDVIAYVVAGVRAPTQWAALMKLWAAADRVWADRGAGSGRLSSTARDKGVSHLPPVDHRWGYHLEQIREQVQNVE